MEQPDRATRLWQEAEAVVLADLQGEAMEEAHEVYVAEAARMRMVDRRGQVRIRLRSQREVAGRIVGPSCGEVITDHLTVDLAEGARAVVPCGAIRTMRDSRPGLRVEPSEGGASPGQRSLTSWLRELWCSDTRLRVLLDDGSAVIGSLVTVANDHVEMREEGAGSTVVISLAAVEGWVQPDPG